MGPRSIAGGRRSRNTETNRHFRQINARFPRRFLRIPFTAIVLSILIAAHNFAHAQSRINWSFNPAREVRWGDTVLPPGEYTFSVSPDDHRLVTVYQKSGEPVAIIAARTVTSEPGSGRTLVFTRDDGNGNYVASLYASDVGLTLTFAQPNNKEEATAASSDATLPEGSLFAIHNSTNQTVPYVQAEAIYLSACNVVGQEFDRLDAVRPRLTLILGAEVNRVDFPKHEIQLKKWNGYTFAQGVVLLAVDDLLPLEKRLSLTKLAMTEAESTVDLRELKNERTHGQTRPQN